MTVTCSITAAAAAAADDDDGRYEATLAQCK
jgi:hypothetical protein